MLQSMQDERQAIRMSKAFRSSTGEDGIRIASGINTRNESSLHKALKVIYSLNEGCRTEVPLDGKVYDIIDGEGNIIEIQTGSVSSLRSKIETALLNGRAVKVVHPIAAIKIIELYDENHALIHSRQSPLHLSIYNMWQEITGLIPVLLQSGFSLDVIEAKITETRLSYGGQVQSFNRRRRWRKSWNKADKRLNEVLFTHTFKEASDYAALIPKECPHIFCAKDVRDALIANKNLPPSASKQSHCMLWVLCRMGLLKQVSNKRAARRDHTNGNTKYYTMVL